MKSLYILYASCIDMVLASVARVALTVHHRANILRIEHRNNAVNHLGAYCG